MSEDIKEQVITEINKSVFGLFSIQLDESVDVSSVSQLMVFVRYAVGTSVKEELLFCSALNTSTKASDVLEKVDHFFNENKISWNNLCGVCTDGAPAYFCLGPKVDFGHSYKVKLLTLYLLIASFTGKFWLPKLYLVVCKMCLTLLLK